MGNKRPAYFPRKNAGRLSFFGKSIFSFSYVEPFGYDNSPNEDSDKFLAKYGAIFPSRQGDEAKNSSTGYQK